MVSEGLHLHFDPVGGIAGDMLCAALLDAFPEHLAGLRSTIAALAPPAAGRSLSRPWIHRCAAAGFGSCFRNGPTTGIVTGATFG